MMADPQYVVGIDYAKPGSTDYTGVVIIDTGTLVTAGVIVTTSVEVPCGNFYPPPNHKPVPKPPLGKRKSYLQTQRELPNFLK
jgi:hypothetical protein